MPKRGENIRKRKDGRWEARFIAGRDCNGKARYRLSMESLIRRPRKRQNQNRERRIPKSRETMGFCSTIYWSGGCKIAGYVISDQPIQSTNTSLTAIWRQW